MMRSLVYILALIFIITACNFSDNEEKSLSESWEKLRSQPSFTLEPNAKVNIINHDVFIKDINDNIKGYNDGISGDLIFDDGSLRMLNAKVDLSSKNRVRFIDEHGSIEMEKSLLKLSYIENANIVLKNHSDLHFYSLSPLRNSEFNVIGRNANIYFHGLSFDFLNDYFFKSGMLSIDNRQLLNSDDIDNFSGRQIIIKSIEDGVCLTIN